MWQSQGSIQNEQEPQAHSSPDRASKWWHVPDGEIEEMIRRLNCPQGMNSSQGATQSRPSALRHRSTSETPAWQRSVRFDGDGDSPQRDSLDQALRDYDERHEPERKRGSWRVSDDTLVEFIKSAKKALAKEVEDVATDSRSLERSASVGRTKLGNAGGYVMSPVLSKQHSSPARISGSSQPLKRQERQPLEVHRAPHSIAKAGGVRYRSGSSRNALSNRPPWEQTKSLPNLFAGVGVGLDGRGSKVVSESRKFEETPIFLDDARNAAFERVRVAVCGHPYYMQGR